MDAHEKWAAVVTCDTAYDGKFYYGVKTTGIFCIPSCKSRPPSKSNILFFDTAEQALHLGLRPCKRCRPDLASYDPAREAVMQAKKVIEQHWANKKKMLSSLRAMGISPNHLAMLFKAQYGVTIGRYRDTLRMACACKMLRETNIPITDVAGKTGFNSLSAFYRFFRKYATIAPGQYRKKHIPPEKNSQFSVCR